MTETDINVFVPFEVLKEMCIRRSGQLCMHGKNFSGRCTAANCALKGQFKKKENEKNNN